MLTIFDIPTSLQQLHQECKSAGTALHEMWKTAKDTVVHHDSNLVKEYPSHIIFVKKGFLKFYFKEKLIRFYSSGDILTINDDIAKLAVIKCEMASNISILPECVHLKLLTENHQYAINWSRYTQKENLLITGLCSVYLKEDINPNIDIIHYSPGETIIREGDHSDCIYEMLKGKASVTVQDTEVGTIHEGEIFGEISFLTESPRTASVIALTQVTVQAIRSDNFNMIVSCRPTLINSMARTTAKRLIEVNERLVKIAALT